MRRVPALLMLAALAAASGCRKQPEGALKVVVIGPAPTLRDPAEGSLSPSDEVLLANVGQGLVRFDPSGNIVGGMAERWTVTDDGLDYLFRLASGSWPDGRKIDAQQVARQLKRELGPRSRNPLKDQLGAVDNIVAMTDRVIEISLVAPRTDFFSLLAQPDLAVLRNGQGSGPFTAVPNANGQISLTRETTSSEDETPVREEVLLAGAPAAGAVAAFADASVDLVLGGTFADLPLAQHARIPRGALRFDPASGLLGLVPARSGGPLDKAQVRQLLSEAIDRDSFMSALGVPGLAPRATLLEPGLDGMTQPLSPSWAATPYAQRSASMHAQANRLFPARKPPIRVALPHGPGADLLFQLLQRDWGALGFSVERAEPGAAADFALMDRVAPSSSPAWFVRRFRCTFVPVCDAQADQLMDAARETPVPAQRFALLGQAAARIEGAQLFIPLTAPVRWSLVSGRIQNFAGNRYARHTLTDLESRSSSRE